MGVKLTKDTLIEGSIVKEGTEISIQVKETINEKSKIKEGFNTMDFQKYVDTLHNNSKNTNYSAKLNVGSDSSVFYEGAGFMYMSNRNLVIVQGSNEENSLWISRKDVKEFTMNELQDDAYIRLISGGYVRLRNID